MARKSKRIDHDALFKKLLTTFFQEFIELFLPEVAAYLDFSTLKAVDKEIISRRRRTADIVMQASYKGEESFFLIHVEHQSKPESNFAWRMLGYFFLLFDKHKIPVYPIVIFSHQEPDTPEPDNFIIAFPDKIIIQFNYTVIQLNRMDWQDYLNRPNPVASALMSKMKVARKDRSKVKLECLRMLFGLGLEDDKQDLISDFIDTYIQLSRKEQAEFEKARDKLQPQEKDRFMVVENMWKREARREARIETTQDNVIMLLKAKFGKLSSATEEKIKKLSVTKLKELLVAVLSFSKEGDLEKWLAEYSKPKRQPNNN
jgi:Putative transposase, YhgA-like/Domain of unknown function (DUF4351)